VAAVPAGATDGAISVTVAGTTTQSRTAFIVGDPDAPTLNGFTPTIGAAGSTVTISGTELSEVEPTRVRLNTNFAPASSVTSTEIIATIPPGTGSGRFTVATPYGIAESPADFFVPPPGFTVEQIAYTGRLVSDVNHPFTLSTSCKTALFAFDGAAGGRVAWQWSGMTFPSAGDATVFRPDLGTLVGSHTATNAFHDSVALPVDGTYSLRYTPRSCGTGSGTLRVWDVPPDDVEAITIDGPAGTVTTTVAGQNAEFRFDATSGQVVTWQYSSNTFTNSADASFRRPDGSTQVGGHTASGTKGPYTLSQTGTYRLLINPRSSGTGSITVTIWSGSATALLAVATVQGDDAAAESPGAPDLVAMRSNPPTSNGPDLTDHEGADQELDWVPDDDDRQGRWRHGGTLPDYDPGLLPRATDGTTALAGLIVDLNGRPVRGVTVAIDHATAETNRKGQFLLTSVVAGQHELWIDGRTAGNAGQYGTFEAIVELTDGVTTVMPHLIWLPKTDRGHAVAISSPTAEPIVVTTPHIPGLELRIPAGAVLTDEDGEPVTEISITPIPVDRPPFPLPDGVEVPVYFTIQPGGAYVEPYARLVYPNYNDLPAGSRAPFWNYDPDGRGWHIYGWGTVTEDGSQVVPDYRTRLYEFSGAMFGCDGYRCYPPDDGPEDGDDDRDGDPIDLSTGLFVLEKSDILIPDLLALSLTRTYRQNDPVSRAFGIGASHPFELFLRSENQYQEVDLILPGGGRIHYVRTSPGTGYADAVFEHTATPGAWHRSTIVWNGDGWDLRLKDGTVFVFRDNAPLASIRDRNGNTITLTRNGGDRGTIAQITGPTGRWIKLSYDASSRVTSATDNLGRTVTYTYDASGRLWKVTDPAGGITEYGYDVAHRMTSITDARGITFLTNEYDAAGRVIRQTQADDTVFEFAYTLDGTGQITQTDVTDPRGFVRRVAFNPSGYTVSDTAALGQPEGQTVSYERASGSQLVTAVVDELGRRTELTYDPAGNLTSTTRMAGTPQAVTTSATYGTAFNLPLTATDELDQSTIFAYDGEGNLTSLTDPEDATTSFTYNAAGQPLTSTDPTERTTTFGYEFGDLTRVTDAAGGVSARYVDSGGRVRSEIDALGSRTVYDYDALNRPTRILDPLGGETTFTYDPNGNLLTLTDARGGLTTWTYDAMDRVASRQDPLLASESFAFDATGNLVEHTDRTGTVTAYRYDALGRRTFVGFDETGTGTPTYESTVDYSFDAGNRMVEADDSAGGPITLAYDLLDRLTSETSAAGSVTYGYDAAGRRISMTAYAQDPVTYAYDAVDRLTSLSQAALSVTFAYDAAGRPISRTLPNGVTASHTFDGVGRLEGIAYDGPAGSIGDLQYGYDAVGRRTSLGGSLAQTGMPAAVASATYDAANRLTAWGPTSLAYDANGDLITEGDRSYEWNARGELVEIDDGSGVVAEFGYDGFGRRRTRTLGATTTIQAFDGVNPVQEDQGGSAIELLTGGIDQFLARTVGTSTQTYLTDALGSTIGLADSAGSVVTSYAYTPFGDTTTIGADSDNGFQFTGRENDGGTGLYYYRARYYNPVLGRFISEDPIGFAAGDVNLYAYVANSPTNAVDPSGLCPICAAAAAAAAGAAIGGAAYGLGTIGLNMLGGRKDWLSGLNWNDFVLAAAAGSVSGLLATAGLSMGGAIAMNSIIGFDTAAWSGVLSGDGTTSFDLGAGVFIGGVGGAIPAGSGASGTARALASSGALSAIETWVTDFLNGLMPQ